MDDMVYIAWYSIVIIENACVLLCEICVRAGKRDIIYHILYNHTLQYNRSTVCSTFSCKITKRVSSKSGHRIESGSAGSIILNIVPSYLQESSNCYSLNALRHITSKKGKLSVLPSILRHPSAMPSVPKRRLEV